MAKWNTDEAKELYNVQGWGAGFFDISDEGEVTASIEGMKPVSLFELTESMEQTDLQTPLLIRFPQIIESRIGLIYNCFKNAAKEYGYKGKSVTVYPIKVNQMRHVVEEIVNAGEKYNIGLEAGSKPELHAVLSLAKNDDAPIICNGYKDEEFIELALLATKMGKEVILVVEKLNELKLIIKTAKRLKVDANIGIRIKLVSSGSGKWEDSGGDKSKFGLTAAELVTAIEIAKEEDFLGNIRLIHFHLGSQITMIRKIKKALREVSNYYVEVKKAGCDIKYVDIGGGLGVDYDGTRSSNASSMNYSVQEYANDAVSAIAEVSESHGLPHPDIITESGRAITAHHSVLVFDVLETSSNPKLEDEEVTEDDHDLIKEAMRILNNLNINNLAESWHDMVEIRQESLDLFSLGHFNLFDRAKLERIYWTVAESVNTLSDKLRFKSSEFLNLPMSLSDKYFCNFSLFQSLPDSWAIDQRFPVMPIHRLNEKPNKQATLQDITCDSDGKIDRFIGVGPNSYSLPLHKLKKDEKYYLGIFLAGAYQEILGDLHNLFGDTNAIHVELGEDGHKIIQTIEGETVEEVLAYVEFSSKKLVRDMEAWVSKAVSSKKISAREAKEYLAIYRSGLYGYTYLKGQG
ncbi:MAG: biosynthetic arginine decarboxylase [Candidatus Kapaibacteriales bacterium]